MECDAYGLLPRCVSIRHLWWLVVWSLRNVGSFMFMSPYKNTDWICSVEIIFFSVIASKVKENANGARTFLEIVKVRFGSGAHLMFLVQLLRS